MRQVLTSGCIGGGLLLLASAGCSLVASELEELEDELRDRERDDDSDARDNEDAANSTSRPGPKDAGKDAGDAGKDAAKPKPDAEIEYPPPSPLCTKHEMGDGTVCLDTWSYVQRAEALCQPRGMYLYTLRGIRDACEVDYGRAAYTCCPDD